MRMVRENLRQRGHESNGKIFWNRRMKLDGYTMPKRAKVYVMESKY